MSLARAIETGDLAELPSRRDEDWRWTDLRGLIREMPAASSDDVGEIGGRAVRRLGLVDRTLRQRAILFMDLMRFPCLAMASLR